jgi:hypothetical protein
LAHLAGLPVRGIDDALHVEKGARAVTVQIGTTAGNGTQGLVDCDLNI